MKLNLKGLSHLELVLVFPVVVICALLEDYYITSGEYDTAFIFNVITRLIALYAASKVVYLLGRYLYRGFKYKEW